MADSPQATAVDVAPVERVSRAVDIQRRLALALKPVLFFLALVLAWQAATMAFEIPVYFIPSPLDVLRKVGEIPGRLLMNSLITLGEVLAGFAMSAIGGVSLAVAIVHSRLMRECVFPLLVLSQVVPIVAIAPILVIWFGSGYLPKILVAFIVSFFPIVVNTSVGLMRVDQDLLYLIRGLNASRWQTLAKIRFPNALPFILSGMRVSITLSVIGAVVGEFVAASNGLGFLVFIGTSQLETPLSFAAIMMLAIMGLGLYGLITWLQRKIVPWASVSETEDA